MLKSKSIPTWNKTLDTKNMMKYLNTINHQQLIGLLLGLCLLQFSCGHESLAPSLVSIEPDFGPAETLVTIEGENLGGIQSITFSGEPINFNNAYNADHALLFRIPNSVPLGAHEVVITTAGGSLNTRFQVTQEPPEIFEVFPESAGPGDQVVIRGENFFEPIEVFFFDSVQAVVEALTVDSLVVTVPEGVEMGFVRVNANGGSVLSPKRFFTVSTIVVNDFDGNGVRAENNKWIFQGSVNENALNAVQSANPAPLEGNFLKLSGKDELGIQWIGGAQTYFGFPGDDFETFNIRTDAANTLLELDLNSNGSDVTHIILIMQEKDGSTNDFTHDIYIDWEGWKHMSVPLNRFRDLNEVIIDPAKARVLKIHLIDNDNTGETLEVNIDNIKFLQ